MGYVWDAGKNVANQIEHGIPFQEACLIFEGDVLTGVDSRRDYGETRRISIGAIEGAYRDRGRSSGSRRCHQDHLNATGEPERKAEVS